MGPPRGPPMGTPHQEVQSEPCPTTGPSPEPPATGGHITITSSNGPPQPKSPQPGRPRREPQNPPAPKAEQGRSVPGRKAQQPHVTGPRGPQRRGAMAR
ncbi:hypothetical protein NDU88_000677 [Pleurodeles waltl]|uniref:Uncharacterized protein n=1 Tax=Pleurodeles waltl TaxID=8319 RepID=A0AAV7LAG2_PLEWA|nr:hypothetical protein NDU88_000677 [Pleurodeles waltl]